MTIRVTPINRIPKSALHVALVSSEICPFARTGGLGDVLGSLPVALEKIGVKVSLVMPAYRAVLNAGFPLEETGITISVPVSNRTETATVLKSKLGKAIPVYFIRADKYFDRPGLYNENGADYSDNAERFVFLSRAILEVLRHDPPQILHANDWQTALSLAFLETQPEKYPEFADAKTIFTIHNLGYQGLFWHLDWHLLNMDGRFFTQQYLEFYNKINFLKAGIVFADKITTVSPTYAEEIKTKEFGFGLEGILKERDKDLSGILNGIDYHEWNPETDKMIAHTYSTDDLTGKARCKAELQMEYGLEKNPDIPVIGWVSRLATQKGCDLLEQIIDDILRKNVQFVMLGNGDPLYSELFRKLPAKYPGRIGVHIGFHDLLVHKIIAGSDMLLLPSKYEPCGLTQMYGLRYGTPPVVRATGGLKDTVEEFESDTKKGTGFVFSPYAPEEFMAAIDRAIACYSRKSNWTALAKNGMKVDFSWANSARLYKEMYRDLLTQPIVGDML